MKHKISDIISAAGLLALIYGFALATLIIPDKEFSEDENRYLQEKPKLTLDSLTSGRFTADIADYFADQFPLRSTFVGIKALGELTAGKGENNGVLLGKSDTLIAENYYPDFDLLDSNLAALNRFAGALGDSELGVPFTVAIAGRSQDVLVGAMPSLYPATEQTERVFDYFNERLEPESVDILTPLCERADSGEYVYYRTDHHWTTLGAYYAYAELMTSWGLKAYPLDYFERETVSDEFYGTTWSKAGMKWISPDEIELFRYSGDDNYTTELVELGESFAGFYDRSYLEKKDKYSVFIGGNNARVRITNGEKRERLMLIKDSFGHALAPFLAAHFELEILDLRYYKNSVYELIGEVKPDRVLVLYNMDSLLGGDSLAMLHIGLPN